MNLSIFFRGVIVDQKLEREALLHCLRRDVDETTMARLQKLSGSNWESLLQQANTQGVAPLLFHRLKDLTPDISIPPGALQRLRNQYLHTVMRNTRLYNTLSEILKTLQDDDIPAIVLKGAHLAEIVYGNIGLRSIGDADILVRKEDLSKVQEKFQNMGYGSFERPSIEEQCEGRQHLIGFRTPEGLAVEIHWTIARPSSPFKLDVDALWKRARPATIAGVQMLILSPEDLLLHLCLHSSFQHKFRIGLRGLCDISATIWHYKDEMDWEQLTIRARKWRSRNCVYFSLHLARELLGADVPGKIVQRARRDPLMKYLTPRVCEHLFSEARDFSKHERLLFQLKMRDRLYDKISYLAHLIATIPMARSL